LVTNEKSYKGLQDQFKGLLGQYAIVLLVSLIFAQFFHRDWVKYLNTYHTILELICVFTALSIFISVWFTYDRNSPSSYILGFGFLAVALFDALHTFYFLKLNITLEEYFDLSTKYWILGRFSEAIILYFSTKSCKFQLSKWVRLVITLTVTAAVSYFAAIFHDYLPVLLNERGVTPAKIMLEFVIIFIYYISLWRIKDKVHSKGTVTYGYIFIAILMSISSEFCFTLYSSIDSISWTVGHVLKIASYCYLFKGIFISTIIYPYEILELEREKLEKSNGGLKNLSETLNDILDTLPMAVLKIDGDTKIEYINKKFEELTNCNRSELYGLTIDKLLGRFPAMEKDGGILSKEELVSGRKAVNMIRTYRMLNGEYKKLSSKTWKIRNGFFSMIREAKEEQELDNLHIQTETILNAVNNCVLMIDINRRVIACNKALAETFEMKREDIIGMSIDELNELVHFEARELPDLALKGESDNEIFEVSLITPNGNKKDLMLYLSSIKNVDGEIIGGISVSNDVTKFKENQQKMMHQEKLALLGQMGAAIVHETRNYLTTIKGRSQLISMLTRNDEVKRHAVKIDSEINEINKIIGEFLFLSKPRQTELTEVSMFDIFRSIKSMVETTSLVKGVEVDITLSNEERYLLCDEGQLKQIILNICKNAVDAMTDMPNAKLIIETGFNEIKNEMFIKITDNGKGISKEDIKKIGTPFFTTKSNGTGLGLSVCFNIIKEHRGRIEIESEVGIGTTFSVVLPCIEDEELEEVI
jgi:PAS domain S-box-containing protein